MEHLFLNLSEELSQAATKIFKSLGIEDIREGDSANALGGEYYTYSIFGAKIKIETNSYDWDDTYRYMISIQRDLLSMIQTTEENIQKVASLVVDLLYRNLKVDLAIEVGDSLIVYNPLTKH